MQKGSRIHLRSRLEAKKAARISPSPLSPLAGKYNVYLDLTYNIYIYIYIFIRYILNLGTLGGIDPAAIETQAYDAEQVVSGLSLDRRLSDVSTTATEVDSEDISGRGAAEHEAAGQSLLEEPLPQQEVAESAEPASLLVEVQGEMAATAEPAQREVEPATAGSAEPSKDEPATQREVSASAESPPPPMVESGEPVSVLDFKAWV